MGNEDARYIRTEHNYEGNADIIIENDEDGKETTSSDLGWGCFFTPVRIQQFP